MGPGEEQVSHQESGDAADTVLQGLLVLGHDSFGVGLLFKAINHLVGVQTHLVSHLVQHFKLAQVFPVLPQRLVSGVVEL